MALLITHDSFGRILSADSVPDRADQIMDWNDKLITQHHYDPGEVLNSQYVDLQRNTLVPKETKLSINASIKADGKDELVIPLKSGTWIAVKDWVDYKEIKDSEYRFSVDQPGTYVLLIDEVANLPWIITVLAK